MDSSNETPFHNLPSNANGYSTDDKEPLPKPSKTPDSWLNNITHNIKDYKTQPDKYYMSAPIVRPRSSINIQYIRNVFIFDQMLKELLQNDYEVFIEYKGGLDKYTDTLSNLAKQLNYSNKIYVEKNNTSYMFSMCSSIPDKSILMVTCT